MRMRFAGLSDVSGRAEGLVRRVGLLRGSGYDMIVEFDVECVRVQVA